MQFLLNLTFGAKFVNQPRSALHVCVHVYIWVNNACMCRHVDNMYYSRMYVRACVRACVLAPRSRVCARVLRVCMDVRMCTCVCISDRQCWRARVRVCVPAFVYLSGNVGVRACLRAYACVRV